jgi:hypothetical protein
MVEVVVGAVEDSVVAAAVVDAAVAAAEGDGKSDVNFQH